MVHKGYRPTLGERIERGVEDMSSPASEVVVSRSVDKVLFASLNVLSGMDAVVRRVADSKVVDRVIDGLRRLAAHDLGGQDLQIDTDVVPEPDPMKRPDISSYAFVGGGYQVQVEPVPVGTLADRQLPPHLSRGKS